MSTRRCVTAVLTLMLALTSVADERPRPDRYAYSLGSADDLMSLTCDANGNSRYDPDLSVSYLTDAAKVRKVELVVGKFSAREGLLAGFEATNGKRLLIRAWTHAGHQRASARIEPPTSMSWRYYGARAPEPPLAAWMQKRKHSCCRRSDAP